MKYRILWGVLAVMLLPSVASAQTTVEWLEQNFDRTGQWTDADGTAIVKYSRTGCFEATLVLEPEPIRLGGAELAEGVRTVDSHPQEVLDLVAAATGDLFQGQNATSIESLFQNPRDGFDLKGFWTRLISIRDGMIDLSLGLTLIEDEGDPCERGTVEIIFREGKDLGVGVYLHDDDKTAIGFDGLSLDWIGDLVDGSVMGFGFLNDPKVGYFGTW